MEEQQKSYRHIFKATSLFGGVQIISILINLVKSKFIAILLGPTGMGISSIFLSVTSVIINIFSLGVNFSAVREISIANTENNTLRTRKTIMVLRRLLMLGGFSGGVFLFLFSKKISFWSFGNEGYHSSFQILSVLIFATCLFNGNIAILQGMQRLRLSAKLTLVSSILGVLLSVPIYYFFGLSGIAYALLASGIIAVIVSEVYIAKVESSSIYLPLKQVFTEGKGMIALGVVMMVSTSIGSLTTFLINTFISRYGTIADLGLYQAGSSITNQYVGMIFTAMSIDYFPRLSAVSDDKEKLNQVVNQQAEIIIIIIAPILAVLIVFSPIIIKLLLSPSFMPVINFVKWVALGMFFKASSYAIGYISFAKGDKKTFFFLEGVGSNILTLICSIIGYQLGGLEGLGIGILFNYIMYVTVISIFTRLKYGFKLNGKCVDIFIIQLFIVVLTLIISFKLNGMVYLFVASILLIVSFLYSVKLLNSRMNFMSFLRKGKKS